MKKRQRKHDYDAILEYIIEHKIKYDGTFPTIRTIGTACGISSTSVVVYILDRMVTEGNLYRFTDDSGQERYGVAGGEYSHPTIYTVKIPEVLNVPEAV